MIRSCAQPAANDGGQMVGPKGIGKGSGVKTIHRHIGFIQGKIYCNKLTRLAAFSQFFKSDVELQSSLSEKPSQGLGKSGKEVHRWNAGQ